MPWARKLLISCGSRLIRSPVFGVLRRFARRSASCALARSVKPWAPGISASGSRLSWRKPRRNSPSASSSNSTSSRSSAIRCALYSRAS
ncbi:hypothetical protein D9M69_481200 [compost metagenome]